MGIKETLACITHPKATLEAKLKQIEEFLQAITSTHTAQSIDRGEEPQRGGVQLEDWSKADQERMLKGELPKGYPLHRNV